MSMQRMTGTERLSDRAYGVVRRMIMECELAPGTAVSEPDLSARLGQNRAGMRAALLRLSAEGLVRPVPRRGYLVSPLTIGDAQELFAIRLMLEPPAAAQAAGRLSARDFAPLDGIYAGGYRDAPQPAAALVAANRRLRVMIADATGNRRLAGMTGRLVDESARYIWLTLVPGTRQEELERGYATLRDAILAGRAAEAEAEVRRQITLTERTLIAALLRHDDIRDQPIGVAAAD